MILTPDNYYSPEANREYLSVSQYKDFCGCYGYPGCEAAAMAKISGEWQEDVTTALLIGSYVDSYFEGTLDQFKVMHPEIFTQKGMLRSEYKHAELMIARAEQDPMFMRYMSGQKQVIMTGEIAGAPFKIKIDSYHPGLCIVDLKTVQSVTKGYYVADLGKVDFMTYWGYDLQLAAYQEVVWQNTGQRLRVFVDAITKERHPVPMLIEIRQNRLDEALETMRFNIPRILRIKNGEQEPDRCGHCDYCHDTEVIRGPIYSDMIDLEV